MLGVVLDSVTHYPGSGGPLVDSLATASVVVQEMWPLFLVLIAILLWVFPDGKLPGGRWRTGVVEQAFQPTQVSIWLALADAGAVSGKIVS